MISDLRHIFLRAGLTEANWESFLQYVYSTPGCGYSWVQVEDLEELAPSPAQLPRDWDNTDLISDDLPLEKITEYADLEEQLMGLQADLSDSQDQASDAQSELEEASSKIWELEERISELEQQLQDLQDRED